MGLSCFLVRYTIEYWCKPTQFKYSTRKMDVPRSLSPLSLYGFDDEQETEMPSTVLFGWDPTAVSAFISKYTAVRWNEHEMAPPLAFTKTPNDFDNNRQFQAAFLVFIASELEGVTSDGIHSLSCTHNGVYGRLMNLMTGLGEYSWVRIVLGQGPPLLRKLAKVTTIAYGKQYELFVCKSVLFD